MPSAPRPSRPRRSRLSRLPALPSLPELPSLPGLPSLPAVPRPTLPGGRRRRHHIPDFDGWTAPEYLAYLAMRHDRPAQRPARPGLLGRAEPTPPPLPPRRAGRDTVREINRRSDVLPVEAVLLARSVTDAAPPPGRPVNPTLTAVLEKYLPESLAAFASEGPRSMKRTAEQLLLSQLDLLAQVTANIQRAQAEHNDRELQIQEAFLRERFADLTPTALDLSVPTGAATDPSRAAATPRPRPKRPLPAAPSRRNAHVEVDEDPVVVFPTPSTPERKLTLRLALPKGQLATLGCVVETHGGATGFRLAAARRWFAAKHPTGFRAPQVDVTLRLDTAGLRRFIVYATSGSRPEPTDTVLFLRDGDRNQAALTTLLANRPAASTTVIASGFVTGDGLVLRNESTLYASLRAACAGFGFRHITWLDEQTPIV